LCSLKKISQVFLVSFVLLDQDIPLIKRDNISVQIRLGTPVDSLDLYFCAGLFFGVKDGLSRPAASAGFKDCRRSRFAGLGTPLHFLADIGQAFLVSFVLLDQEIPLIKRDNIPIISGLGTPILSHSKSRPLNSQDI
jgi:hypothetical protein